MGIIDRKLLWLALSGTGAANLSGADALLDGEAQGLAFDFTDQSVRIIDTSTPSNSTRSTGIVNQGSLVGPSGKLTYTSPSNKLTRQSDGYYKYQAHNILQYSSLDGVSAGSPGTAPTGWTWFSSGTVTNSALNNDAITFTIGSGARVFAYRAQTGVIGQTYCFAAYVTIDSGTVTPADILAVVSTTPINTSWTYQGSSTTSSTALSGSGWLVYRFDASVSASITCRFGLGSTAAGSGAQGVTVSKPHLYRYPSNTDYIKTTSAEKFALPIEYDTGGNCLGLLVEEARTNLCLYSGQFDNAAWTKSDITLTANQAVAPNGLTHADLFADNATASFHRAIQTITVSSGAAYTASVYVKNNTAGYVGLRIYGNTNSDHIATEFNLSTGAVDGSAASAGATFTAITQTITDVGNGWYRITKGFTSTNTSIDIQVVACNASGQINGATTLPSYSGTGTSVLIWGAQAELGSFPTSPVVTYSAASTRNGDTIYMPLSSTPLPGMTGASDVISGYAQFESVNESSPGRYVFSARNEAGGNANTVYVYQSTTTQLASTTTDAGGQTAFMNPGPNVAGADWQVAWRAKNDDYAISVAGLAQKTDTTADVMGVALDRLYIGKGAGGAQGNRTIQKIVFVPSEWSNATLETKVGN